MVQSVQRAARLRTAVFKILNRWYGISGQPPSCRSITGGHCSCFAADVTARNRNHSNHGNVRMGPSPQRPTISRVTQHRAALTAPSLSDEPIERLAHLGAHRVAPGVPRVADDDQLRVGPSTGKFPGRAEWTAQVEAAVN